MYSGTEYASLADRYGFIVVYPSVTRASKCFDVSSPQALTGAAAATRSASSRWSTG
jgi:poly(3-hydroxybutyrate) depolymerase